MKAQVVDFYDKKLNEEAVLKVFNYKTGEEIFKTHLGKRLLRRLGPRTLSFNRSIQIQYVYTQKEPIRVEAYIFLGKIAAVAFPMCVMTKDQIVRFETKKDQVLHEGEVSQPEAPSWRKTKIAALVVCAALLFWIGWKLIS